MPTGDATYELRIPEGAEVWIPDAANDKAVKAVLEGFKETGATQAEVDACWKAIKVLGDKGVLQPAFNPETEITALSENGQDGKARQGEQQTFLTSLKERGEIGDAEFSELMSLVPTAAGTRALEQLRKAMSNTESGINIPASQGVETAKAEAQKQAREMANDPRYKSDRQFRAQADAAYKTAFA